MAFLLHVLSERDVFVDVGANVGSYTILAGAVAGARGYAFEPVPATYRRLIENIRLNHLENRVTAVNIGIGRAPGVVDFTSDLDTVNHALAPGEPYENAIKVEIATLDTMLAGQHPSLIKIDVEGYESSVLAGASAVLEEPTLNAVIMELNGSGRRYNEDESGILKMMIERGFKSYSYDPFARALTPMNGSNPASGNTLFIRNEAAVLERIAASPFFNVHGKRL
jgi:FkbM family methyltransferase